ncbi:MAG: PQQ-binding-like beta-propeller repeat protein [Calditrichaeota bacterium]|nr:PQQ-binding-like beta-propeller repeat protein [Candidatus Cloacimonadota bacterium]MCA9786720.1 PQQ-binding-like beta-propeller repeat protein [Candidatus Cloacimonadota bacterium]MCB1045679.1 PQQ-binding-like beta-propeller repeat protein [Calditrichota bacterium]
MMRLLAFCLVFWLSQTAHAANVEASWTQDFQKEIDWQKLSDAGYLVIGNKDAIFGVDPADGKIVWTLEQFKKMPEDFLEVLDGTQFGAITYKGGVLGFGTTTYLVDLITGTILWDTSTIELGNCSGQFYLPEAGGLLIFGYDKKGKPITKLVDLATGSAFWSADDWYKPGKTPQLFSISTEKKSRLGVMGNQRPLFLEDGSFLELMSVMGLRRINAETGKIIWSCDLKIKGVPAPKAGYAPITLSTDGKTVYVPHDNNVVAVNVADGKVLWNKPEKLRGIAYQMAYTEKGLVVRGGPGGSDPKGKPFIMTLDTKSGEKSWKKPFKDLESASSFVIDGDKIVIYADSEIHQIDIASGDHKELADKIKLGDGEIPHTLELRDNGYLLISSQNLALYDTKGKQVYWTYNRAPQAGMLAKIASTAVILAVNAASVANAYGQANARAAQSASGRGEASYTLITKNPVMSERFAQSESSQNFVYMLADVGPGGQKAGAGVIQVDKVTGANMKSVVLGTKDPVYEVDELGGRLFFKSGKSEITCFKF